jgi:DNA repair protein RecO (recombination protein O)
MPLHHSEAYVLRTYTLKEADKICVLLTRESGKVRGVAQGARRLKSKFGSSLEPFTEVLVSYLQKENRELVTISSCEIIKSQFPVDLSGEYLGVLHYLAELIIEFVPDHEPNPHVYRLAGAAMDVLREGTPAHFGPLARYCEIWMLRLAGFLPDLARCANCGEAAAPETSVWLTSEGSAQCDNCSSRRGLEIRSEVRRSLAEILNTSPREFVSRDREPRVVNQIAAIAARLIGNILDRDLRSPEIIGQLRLSDHPADRQRTRKHAPAG